MPNHIHLIISLPHTEAIHTQQSSLQQIIAPDKGLQPLVPG